jgi:iron complex transport system substrate-binding protein
MACREVQQPAVEVLDLQPESVELLDHGRELCRGALGGFLEPVDARGVETAAVPGDRTPDRAEVLPGSHEVATPLDQLLGERPNVLERRIRLLRREEAHWGIVTQTVRRLLAPLVLAVLAVSGCGERAEPLGDVPQPYPVTVDGAGEQPTVVEDAPARIVALDPGSAELLLALEVGRKLVGMPAGVENGRGIRTVVTRTGQVDVKEVARLEPDLLVATPSSDLVDVSQAERESGAVLYVQPDSSVDEVMRGTLELGLLVGQPVQARRLVAAVQGQIERVESRLAETEEVTAFVDTGFFITISERSLLGDLIRRARGRSVAGAAPGPDPFPLPRLRTLDPDVYLATSESRVTLKSLRTDPRTAELEAVRSGRFALLPSELVLRAGPRIGRALERVAQALHPDVFP